MGKMRIIDGIHPGTPLEFTFEGRKVSGFEGESIASALMRAGISSFRFTRIGREARGYYCGMGICWECAVYIENDGIVRSCSYPVRQGLSVSLADGDRQ
jgi:sarcosine oxidase subunit alpha